MERLYCAHGGKFAFPVSEIVILLHQNILDWLYATPEISGATDKISTKVLRNLDWARNFDVLYIFSIICCKSRAQSSQTFQSGDSANL